MLSERAQNENVRSHPGGDVSLLLDLLALMGAALGQSAVCDDS